MATVPHITAEQEKITKLRTSGFRPLKPDHIHVRCPDCGRKRSNGPRAEYDPPNATLIEVACGECGMGTFPEPEYFDEAGNYITHIP